MTLTTLLIPTFVQMLRALSGWLTTAAAHAEANGEAPDALMAERLAPDMFPLAAQVRFVCFQAQEASYRMRGEPVPEAVTAVQREGSQAGEQPGTMADAQARVEQALAALGQIAPDIVDGLETQLVVLELPNGMIFDLTGEQYARDWSLPQFNFHLITAYAILRSRGVPLGKIDYVGAMLPYLRPGTMPATMAR